MRVLICTDPANASAATALSRALADAEHEVHLIVPETGDARLPSYRSENVAVSGAGEYPPMIPDDDGLSRALQTNLSVLDRGTIALVDEHFDLIHAFGIEIVYAAGALARLFDLPVVASIRAPARRAQPIAQHWTTWLATEAARVLAPSSETARRLAETFDIPAQKITILRRSRASSEEARTRSLVVRTAAVYDVVLAEHAGRSRARRSADRRPRSSMRLGSTPAAR